MKTLNKTIVVAATPAAVLRAVTCAAYEEAASTLRDNIESTSVKELEHTDARVVLEVTRQEHPHTMGGSVDKSKTETGITKIEWDLAKSCSTWTYSNAAHKTKLSGTVEIKANTADATRSDISFLYQLDLGIPIIGGQIEGLILKGMSGQLDRTPALIEAIVAKQ